MPAPETRTGEEDGVIDIKADGHRRPPQQAVLNLRHRNPVDRRLLGQLGHVGADPQRLRRGGARHNGAVQREQERSRRKGESKFAHIYP